MDWDALGRELGEWLLDFWGQDIPGLHSSHFSGEKLSPPRVKSITLPCGIPLPPLSGNPLATTQFYSVLVFFLFVCLFFLQSCILTLAEEKAT